MPARYILHFTAPGWVPLGIPTSPGNVFKKMKVPLIADRAAAGTREEYGGVYVKHNLIMTTVPGLEITAMFILHT